MLDHRTLGPVEGALVLSGHQRPAATCLGYQRHPHRTSKRTGMQSMHSSEVVPYAPHCCLHRSYPATRRAYCSRRNTLVQRFGRAVGVRRWPLQEGYFLHSLLITFVHLGRRVLPFVLPRRVTSVTDVMIGRILWLTPHLERHLLTRANGPTPVSGSGSWDSTLYPSQS
jgi:hypothetical protein